MLLTLMRHGVAESWAASDADRRLTAGGEKIVTEVVAGLKSGGWLPGCVVCSPLTRSRQTADLIIQAFPGTVLEITKAVLEPDEGLLDELAWREMVDPLVIGHEPGLSRLAAQLLGSRGILSFQPAAVACFRVDGLPPRNPAEMLFFAPPIFARCFRG